MRSDRDGHALALTDSDGDADSRPVVIDTVPDRITDAVSDRVTDADGDAGSHAALRRAPPLQPGRVVSVFA